VDKHRLLSPAHPASPAGPARANERHGVRLKSEDRQKRIDAAILMPENEGKSANWLGKLCNVSDHTIAVRRKSLEESGQLRNSEPEEPSTSANGKVRGKDGKLYPATRPAAPKEPAAVDAELEAEHHPGLACRLGLDCEPICDAERR
jgi:hypothetical protein